MVGSIQLRRFYERHSSLLARDPLWTWWICCSAWLDTDVFWSRAGQDGGAASFTASVRQGCHVLQATLPDKHLNDDHSLAQSDPHTHIFVCPLRDKCVGAY